jgi:hypothetical protein
MEQEVVYDVLGIHSGMGCNQSSLGFWFGP